MNHTRFMKEALILAGQALEKNEFPVGCVIVHRDTIIARGWRTHSSVDRRNEIDHAEINALKQIDPRINEQDRREMTIYSTMEPCLMCFAAIILSGIRHIVYAYEDAMGGGTACHRENLPPLYRDPDMVIVPGVMRNESLALFKRFFLSPENQYWKGSFLETYTLSTQ